MTTTIPFTLLDEAIFHLEQEYTPWNIQLEVETTATLDEDRLRDAVASACHVHPLATARRRSAIGLDTGYVWELPDEIDDPIRTADADSPADLAALQTRFYRQSIDLTNAPPFRIVVARGAGIDGGDRLLVCMSHVPADGVGVLRFVRSITREYRQVNFSCAPDAETNFVCLNSQ